MTDKKITNTTREAQERPEATLLSLVVGGTEKTITDMERNGTRELAAQTTTLPAEGSDDPAWAKMGVIFGEVNSEDRLFRAVTLPPGWKIATTDHSMWNSLLDEKGRKRGMMFYKAAFYDRTAHIRPNARYHVASKYDEDYSSRRMQVQDDATGAVLKTWPVRTPPTNKLDTEANRLHWATCDADADEATKYLLENFPQYRDAAAYWND